MWLLDANEASPTLKQILESTLEQNRAIGKPACQYAILSHRWEKLSDEPDFSEVRSGDSLDEALKIGRVKVERCCSQARIDGLQYVWVDTCCIDRTSSAELQESINSMYHWYERAAVCYVYLRDVHKRTFETSFPISAWFTRGWTLQELIAPSEVRFYDRDWQYLGDKRSLRSMISLITGISIEVLIGYKRPRECSVAQRMSWAAKRRTTRLEDRAYSLLGLFGVNMPMLYGEGDRAFYRLQEEIIKTTYDHSVFAWTGIQRGLPGLLAPSLECFADSGDVENVRVRSGREPYTMTNRGLSIKLGLVPYYTDTYVAMIHCSRDSKTRRNGQRFMGIFLRHLYEDDQYARVAVSEQQLLNDVHSVMKGTWQFARWQFARWQVRTISVRQREMFSTNINYEYAERESFYGFRIDQTLLWKDQQGEDLFTVHGNWDPHLRTLTLPPGSPTYYNVGAIDVSKYGCEIMSIQLGFDFSFNPVVFFADDAEDILFRGIRRLEDNENAILPHNRKGLRGPDDYNDGEEILKGHRIDGLICRIPAKSSNEISRGGVQIKRGLLNDRLIWDVHVWDCFEGL